MLKLNCDVDGVIQELVEAPEVGRFYADAIAWMARPYCLETNWFQEIQWTADRRFAYGPLLDWERSFVRRFRKLGVPVHCDRMVLPPMVKVGVSDAMLEQLEPYVMGYACDMVHSTLGDMPPICWEVFRHVGEELAEAHDLDLTWGGDERPWAWRCSAWREWRFAPPASQDFDIVDRLRKIHL